LSIPRELHLAGKTENKSSDSGESSAIMGSRRRGDCEKWDLIRKNGKSNDVTSMRSQE
jgi:hypothetical protein